MVSVTFPKYKTGQSCNTFKLEYHFTARRNWLYTLPELKLMSNVSKAFGHLSRNFYPQ